MRRASRRHLLAGTTLPLALVAMAYGCNSKDYLTNAATPQGVLNEQTLTTVSGVEGSLIATYRAMDWNSAVGGTQANAASNWIFGSVASDDAYKGTEVGDFAQIEDIEKYNWGTGSAQDILNDKWKGMYEGISRANATLRLLKQVNPGLFDAASNQAKSIEGEATFLRAHYHFELYRIWGNVPYYREADTDFRKASLTAPEVLTEILKDLDAAIALLPTSPRGGQKGRVTQWTAKAYKGRVQMYAGQFQAALTTLRDVRNSGPYKLEPSFDRVWTGFADRQNGPETILAYQASSNDGATDGNNANYGERLNFPYGGPMSACCGFHQPSQNLVNYYRVDANGLPIALSNPSWNSLLDTAFTAAVSANVEVDPRLDWTVGRDGVPYKDWGKHERGWIRSPSFGGPYSPKKNVHEKASGAQSNVGWVPQQLNSVNIHVFRYADMLLLLAEAEVEAGSLESARQIVNEIRTRAGQTAQGPGTDAGTIAVPINDPRITWAKYRVGTYPAGSAAFASQAAARNAVRAERRLELAMEGQRFFDLRRWGIMQQTIADYLAVEKNRRTWLAAATLPSAKHQLYPIPTLQVDLSKVNGQPMLKQNPGW